MRTAVLYAVFAGIATLVNLLAQMATVRIYAGAYSIPVSVLAGTIAGIAVKYLLDKHYIFRKAYSGVARHLRSAALYLLASVATTLIFWGAETIFQIAFGTAQMRYLGGAIGLAIGYVIKYHLDKRFAFA
jgi:putative flippase GtrA